MPANGFMPRAAVAREAENRKRRREMAFSVAFGLFVMIVAVSPRHRHQRCLPCAKAYDF
jgi:hypothetical protein